MAAPAAGGSRVAPAAPHITAPVFGECGAAAVPVCRHRLNTMAAPREPGRHYVNALVYLAFSRIAGQARCR